MRQFNQNSPRGLALVRYMRRVYDTNLALGGTEHNSRIVASLDGAHRYGFDQARALRLLDLEIGKIA